MEMPERIGKYEVTEQIGVGGFGVIYKGRDPFIKRQVAIKMCATPDMEVRQRFQREAELAGNLVHPNITLVFDFGIENEVPYLVQEFLTGFDLDEMVKAGVLSDPASSVSILLQVCEGMDFAHSRGVVHRDLKPSNIRVLEDGTVKIMDFGIAKSLEGGTKLTQTGIALGTAGYLAPEQIKGVMVDPRTDIFSLGVVAYEMVTGQRPFEGSSLSNVLYRILNEEPETPITLNPDCPPILDQIIRRCLAKDPNDRYQTVREVADQLRRITLREDQVPGATEEIAVGVLREVLQSMGKSERSGGMERTTNLSDAARTESASREPVLSRGFEPDEHKEPRRNPVLITFVVFLALLLGGAAALYLSPQLQELVFGPEGAPWVPTPTPTPTATPTPTPIPTPTMTPTPTPLTTPAPERVPTPTPTLPVSVRLVLDPPAILEIDGRPYKSGRVLNELVELRPGSHTFTLSLPDYDKKVPFNRTVSASTGTISLQMPVGQITVMVDQASAPPGGAAFFDGEWLGKVPLIKKKVPSGEHELVVRWDGYRPFRQTVTIQQLGGDVTTVFAAPPQ